ncbi:LysR substrate-binding domain-containing protein [Halobacteriovorax sp. HLS]|uniref:LysR substrate-binding domain-containing protein n=1 Tax=Halobacteriovorax sp. HLS TaxID=2234000 RepID=UPI001F4EAF49|nr:LysR substrate-binding domain-containing protein [Halobacteriovorax sp. HLS]
MTLTQLEYVVAVNKHRHFGKAAKECHVTQPTLSMQLQKLEDELGVILFDRSKSPILPTSDGEKVVKQAQVVIKEYNRIHTILEDNNGQISGKFRLAVIPTLAAYVIPLFAKKFADLYPQVELIIEEFKTEEIIDLLDREEIDAGILVTPLHEGALIERVLFYEPFHLFVSQDHELYKKSEIQESELSDESLWLLNEGHCFRAQVLKVCSMNFDGGSYKNLRFESGNLETLKNLVVQSSGYTLLPHLATLDLSAARKKMVKPFRKPVPTREVSIVYGRTFLKEKIIDALEELIVSVLPKEIHSHKGEELSVVEFK